ncbi:hypothetical protein NHQ30_009339 [Ciborinia camelliae]|nr:hypothetical protein NHQ30_009339 [Ciborinia camelliae]
MVTPASQTECEWNGRLFENRKDFTVSSPTCDTGELILESAQAFAQIRRGFLRERRSGLSEISVQSRIWHLLTVGFRDLDKNDAILDGPYLELIGGVPGTKVDGLGKVLNEKWIEPSLFLDWKKTCDREHDSSCCSRFLSHGKFTTGPTWLIDTLLRCLVPAPKEATYLALSYVWGSKNTARTVMSNLELLQREKSLGPDQAHFQIPRTIRDAMTLVELLEERYLWVDSLCIVQDDEISSTHEINNMASIYANATVTIVAAQGADADFGLRGLRSSQARSLTQKIVRLGEFEVLKLHFDGTSGEHTVWNSRGWTFQEHLFSHRLLFFDKESVSWECGNETWYEDRKYAANISRKRTRYNDVHTIRKGLQEPLPDIWTFFELLEIYKNRTLTYSNDGLRAFMGVIRTLEHKFEGGFIGGLPVFWLDVALLWQQNTFSMRIPANDSPDYLPSWSWAGWTGDLDLRQFCASFLDVTNQVRKIVQSGSPIIETLPLVRWSIREHGQLPSSLSANNWHEFKSKAHKGTIPEGWQRLDANFLWDTKDPKLQWPMKYYYTHDYSEEIYTYPVPYRDPSQSPTTYAGTLLSCRTTRAYLSLSEEFDIYHPDNPHCTILRRTIDDSWAGILKWVNRERCEHGKLFCPSCNKTARAFCELVAISMGRTSKDIMLGLETGSSETAWKISLPEFGHEEGPNWDEPEEYEFYNCLWIEWIDGIAYRKALGRVKKSVWESLDLEEIDLLLG